MAKVVSPDNDPENLPHRMRLRSTLNWPTSWRPFGTNFQLKRARESEFRRIFSAFNPVSLLHYESFRGLQVFIQSDAPFGVRMDSECAWDFDKTPCSLGLTVEKIGLSR